MTRACLLLRLLLAAVLGTLGVWKLYGLTTLAASGETTAYPTAPYWIAGVLEVGAAVLLLGRPTFRAGAIAVTFGFLGAAGASVLLGVDGSSTCRCLGPDPGPRSVALAVLGGVVVLSSMVTWLGAAPTEDVQARAS